MLNQRVSPQFVSSRQDIFFSAFTAVECCHLTKQPEVVDGIGYMLLRETRIGSFSAVTAELQDIHVQVQQDWVTMVVNYGYTC